MENRIEKRIYTLRGVQVMLDTDLAEIYGVKTGLLNEAVKRNMERFPGDFMFKTTKEEIENLKSQSAISSSRNSLETDAKLILRSQSAISSLENSFKGHGGNRHTPLAFTEFGVAMLSSVLGSQRAIEINIEIMRAFVQLRKQPKANFESLENKLDLILQRLDGFKAQPQDKKRDPIRLIQDAVAKYWGLTTEDLKSAKRTKEISLPRQIAIYLIRKHMHISFSDIGLHFGRRDHSTILHAYRKINAASDSNNMIKRAINSLQSVIDIDPIQML